MEDLRYILKDYKREKKLHQKKVTTLEIIIRIIVCVLAVAVILSLHLKCFLLTIGGIAILIVLLVWYNNKEYKYFSKFGEYKSNKDDTETSASKNNDKKKDDKKEDKKETKFFGGKLFKDFDEYLINESKIAFDEEPEWFGDFLKEKGIDKYNIDLLIEELSVKYDYPVLTSISRIAPWIIGFIGFDNILKAPWYSREFILMVLKNIVINLGVIFVLENQLISQRKSLNPLIMNRGKKEELLHDLKIQRMKWNKNKEEETA
mgnify:CR=1 FL=1